MDKLAVGVVGVGHLGKHHARILADLKECKLYGVVDIDQRRAEEIAAQYQTRAFIDYHDLIGKVDAVSIAAPTIWHYQIARDFLAEGIDVLVEKPMTETLEHARELIDLADRHKAILQVGHLERFNGAVLALEKYIHDPRFIESHRIAPFVERGVDVDVVLDLMIHDIDIILSLVKSRARRIEAVGVPVISSKIDIANARLEFENGCLANVTASRVSLKKERKMRIFQKDAYFSLNYAESKLYSCTLSKEAESSSPYPFQIVRNDIPVQEIEPLRAELEAFVHSCRSREKPTVSGEEGYEALCVAFKILEKISTS
ncbi:MAG: Gfo/Idh/MocA family oxidoreductase [bacterium]|nr:Gfo/Idh/MocA family oxidoreductase [bacterium]